MTKMTIDEMKRRRLATMSDDERAEFDETYEATRLALEVGEHVGTRGKRPASASGSSLRV